MTERSQARAMLDEWRVQGDDRVSPLRFAFIDSLERRTSAERGEARRLLDARLQALLHDYAREVELAAPVEPSRKVENTPLAVLVADMNARVAHASQSELLEYFREVWARLSAEQRLNESLARVPKNAGPLNSSSLVHRSLALMREVSPAYLQHFLAYLDGLSWMEEMAGDAPAVKKPMRGKAARG
ncbi:MULTISPECIES: DUF2894 domain-containing protein [unclassified Caballeronia]|uniref:DUF2894 domain-containing protein n=1 Tax=unclassified Caballeronia TaxID=2646786 RepID=UPI00286429C6|nr:MULTISPECIES: DUF2894 domain-containing protein [unclassified Caballeronia]MDR5774614.1 DUF2894 domain-containing protein [Caballeronia sp. LZ002]MDR5850050.1 DUF2894 domain-containing protein [Caballeronia sp. LZ003]